MGELDGQTVLGDVGVRCVGDGEGVVGYGKGGRVEGFEGVEDGCAAGEGHFAGLGVVGMGCWGYLAMGVRVVVVFGGGDEGLCVLGWAELGGIGAVGFRTVCFTVPLFSTVSKTLRCRKLIKRKLNFSDTRYYYRGNDKSQ